MGSEIRVTSILTIAKNNLQFNNSPTAFVADMAGAFGPTPGAISASTSGTLVDLSELSTAGMCVLQNLDATNYVTYGTWDGADFVELGEMLPGEVFVIRLSRVLTSGTATVSLRIVADTAACDVVVSAFDA